MARNSVARSSVPAAKPVTPTSAKILAGALSSKLDAAHLAIERLDKVIMVAVSVLYDQDIDLDSSVATVLENAAEVELNPARKRIEEAMKLVGEVASHG